MLAERVAAVHLRRLSPIDFLERSADVYREKVAVIDGTTRRTYPQMLERVYRFANALEARGIVAGDRVAVLAKNQSALLEAHFAVPLAGAILCALNVRLVASEIGYILRHCGAKLVVYDSEFEELLADAPPELERIPVGGPGGEDYESLLAGADPAPVEHVLADEDATIAINYTSGTTGQPKGVMYTYRGAYQNALAEAFVANLRPESVYLWTLPMFHCNGWCFP